MQQQAPPYGYSQQQQQLPPHPNTMMPPSPISKNCVFVNGEKCELLEDRRLALYLRFPVGTKLYDPTCFPPQHIPLSTLPDEVGVTCRKLLPYGHYVALMDNFPVIPQYNCLLLFNLPFNTDAEKLGKFFEDNYALVVEADIMRWPNTNKPKGRGYVILNDAEVTQNLLAEQVIDFGDTKVYVVGTNRQATTVAQQQQQQQQPPPPPPQGAPGGHPLHPPPPPPSYQATAVGPPASGGMPLPPPPPPNVPQPRRGPGTPVQNSGIFFDPNSGQKMPMGPPPPQQQHGPSTGGGPPMQAPNNPHVTPPQLANWYFFVVHLSPEQLQDSTSRGVFWTTRATINEFEAVSEKGPVTLIFMIPARHSLFGFASLTTPLRPTSNGVSPTNSKNVQEVAIKWEVHSVNVTQQNLDQFRISVNVFSMSDGTQVKPEIGKMLCDLIADCAGVSRPQPPIKAAQRSSSNATPVSQGG